MPSEMSFRYLTVLEATQALSRGGIVEVFLGECFRDEIPGICWIQISAFESGFKLYVFESADNGSEDFTDVYEFGPLNPDLEQEDPDEVHTFSEFDDCIALLEQRWPGSSARMVNEFLVQEEYADYIRKSHKA